MEDTTTTMTMTMTMTMTRIFVGGLGGSVTADDLRSTFSSLGSINSVQIVRTKGRSIAYFDFLPSSDKSLSKLFSTYNGCMWKGGRLKLERAKEHYPFRLRREWAEDATFPSNASVPVDSTTKNTKAPEHKKALKPEKMQLRIFFPQLKKVKLLPASGTGKHKYSFQRIEVPSLPIHFCDCEEHSSASKGTKEEDVCDVQVYDGGVDEKEFDMMHIVMNKLLAKDNSPKTICSGNELIKGHYSTNSVDKLPVDKLEVDEIMDEDNLVMNMTVGGKDPIAHLSPKPGTILKNKASEYRRAGSVPERTIGMSRKKRKLSLTEAIVGDEVVSAKSETKMNEVKYPKPDQSCGTRLLKERNNSTTSVDDLNENKTGQIMDEQSLLLNVVTGRKDSSTMTRDQVEEAVLANEVTRVDEVEMPEDGKRENELQYWQTNIVTSNEERKLVHIEDREENVVSSSHERSQSGKDNLNEPTQTIEPKSGEVPKTDNCNAPISGGRRKQDQEKYKELGTRLQDSKEGKELVEIQPVLSNAALDKSTRSASWLQKSSWTQLVGETGSSFSIAHILPSATFRNQQQPESKGIDIANSANGESHNLVSLDRFGSSKAGPNMVSSTKKDQNLVGADLGKSTPEERLQIVGEKKEVAASKENYNAAELPSVNSFAFGETCSFMRNAASMKEWMNAKAALSGSLKKKGKEQKEIQAFGGSGHW